VITVWALGITQIIGWGSTFYFLGVLANALAADRGWSLGFVYSGLTCGLLVSGGVSTPIGRLIDRHGARGVMTAGSVLSAVGLALIAKVESPAAYLAEWALTGLAMRMTLYEAAFAAIVQVAPVNGRRSISALTLFGGLASSLFWPLGHELAAATDWRTTLLIFASLNLVVCAPLHWVVLGRKAEVAGGGEPATAAAATAPVAKPAVVLEGRNRRIGIVVFAIAISLNGIVFGALAVHLVPLLAAFGLSSGAAVVLASFKGAAQVAGRLWELTLGRQIAPLNVGRIAIWGMPAAFAMLLLPIGVWPAAIAFTIVYGLANGLVTIVRGAVPLALFGSAGYGEVLGLISTPYLVLTAVAPALLALVVEAWGYLGAGLALFAVGLVAGLAIEVMTLWYRALMARTAA
jgi:hypothetical protein